MPLNKVEDFKVVSIVDDEDGGATVVLELTQKGRIMLLQAGFNAIMRAEIERTHD